MFWEDGDGKDQPRYIIFNAKENWTPDKSAQTATQNVQFEFTYDEHGQRATVIYPMGMVKSMADFDRATSAALETTDTLVTVNDERNTVNVARPEGSVAYGYDSEGVLDSMSWLGRTIRYEHDFWGRLSQCEANEGRWEYRYGALTAPLEIAERASGERELRSYDGLGRTQSIDHRDSTDAIIFRIEYAMGIDGTRRGATETRGGDAAAWAYEYDELGRLAREKRDEGNDGTFERDISYQYDADSNRVDLIDNKIPGLSIHYEYDGNTQRLLRERQGGQLLNEYGWTADGEQDWVKRYINGAHSSTEDYAWANGRMVGVHFTGGRNDGYRLELTYDSAGNLVRRKVWKGSTLEQDRRYLVDTLNPTGYSQILAEIDGISGKLVKFYSYADRLMGETEFGSGGGTSGDVATPAVRRHHADALGSVRAITGTSSISGDSSASPIAAAFNYEAFGSPLLAGQGSSAPTGLPDLSTRFAFTGQLRDELSGLQYHRARRYSSQQSRWTAKDAEFDFAQNMGHLYTYCSRLSLNALDQTGTESELSLVTSLAIVAILTVAGAGFGYAMDVANQKMSTGGSNYTAKGAMIGMGLGFALVLFAMTASDPLMKSYIEASSLFTMGFVAGVIGSLHNTWGRIFWDGILNGLIAVVTGTINGKILGKVSLAPVKYLVTVIWSVFVYACLYYYNNAEFPPKSALLTAMLVAVVGNFGQILPDGPGSAAFMTVFNHLFSSFKDPIGDLIREYKGWMLAEHNIVLNWENT